MLIHPINTKQFQEYNLSLENISISIQERPPKNLLILTEDLKFDYGENLQVKH